MHKVNRKKNIEQTIYSTTHPFLVFVLYPGAQSADSHQCKGQVLEAWTSVVAFPVQEVIWPELELHINGNKIKNAENFQTRVHNTQEL